MNPVRDDSLGGGFDEARALAVERNCWEFFMLMARAGGDEIYDGDDVKWVRAGGRVFNRVFAARFTADPANRIAEVTAQFVATGSSVLWLTGPSTTPADLGSRIEAAGFSRSADWAGMDADLEEMSDAEAEPSGCRILRVRTLPELDLWMWVMSRGFGLQEDSREATYRRILAVGFEDGPPLRHYLAFLDGTPAAAASIFLGTESAGIYFVTTLPWARRRGLGTAVTRRTVADLTDTGLSRIVLQATREGEMLYRKMGFTRRCSLGVYFLDAAQR